MSLVCPVCASPVGPDDTVCKVCGNPLTPAAAVALPAGYLLHNGQYRLNRVLGRGGFGITYEAQDLQLGLRVAVKELFVDGSSRRGQTVLPPMSLSAHDFQETKKRFLDEAKVLARFHHPGIVRVLNYFEENATAYLVMEFLEGRTVGGEIEKQGKLPPQLVLDVARAVAETLEHIHGAGLLHRDIKPDNIFLTKDGRVVLIDFGSVRAFAPGKTMSHTRLVTPGYAPLEQYGNSAKFGPYTDIYALGATLHHALTGQMPPAATDLMLGTPLPDLPSGTPMKLTVAIQRAMALKVQDRPQSAEALLALLGPPDQHSTVRVGPSTQTPPPPRPAPAPAPMPQRTPTRQTPPTPQPAPAPAPRQAPAPAPPPARPAPQPAPTPRPAPQPAPVVPQPAPKPVPAPAPAPQPRPAPVPSAPNAPVPKPPAQAVKRNNSFVRTAFLLLCVGFGAVVGWQQLPFYLPQLTDLGNGGVGISLAVGAVAGFMLGWLAWWSAPFLLPVAAAGAAFLYAQGAGLHWPTVVSLSIIAAILSIFFLRLIRRI